MAMSKTKEVGGGPATGLADDFVSSLQKLLNGGGMGTAGSPLASGNPLNVLVDILGKGGGNIGGAFSEMLSKQQDRDVNNLRSRFGAGGGTAFGSPAAYAESMYRAEAAPQITSAIGNLQLGALGPLMEMMGSFAHKGVSQRQTIQEPTTFGNIVNTVSQVGKAAAPFLLPGIGMAPHIASAVDSFSQMTPNVRGSTMVNRTSPPMQHYNMPTFNFGGR